MTTDLPGLNDTALLHKFLSQIKLADEVQPVPKETPKNRGRKKETNEEEKELAPR